MWRGNRRAVGPCSTGEERKESFQSTLSKWPGRYPAVRDGCWQPTRPCDKRRTSLMHAKSSLFPIFTHFLWSHKFWVYVSAKADEVLEGSFSIGTACSIAISVPMSLNFSTFIYAERCPLYPRARSIFVALSAYRSAFHALTQPANFLPECLSRSLWCGLTAVAHPTKPSGLGQPFVFLTPSHLFLASVTATQFGWECGGGDDGCRHYFPDQFAGNTAAAAAISAFGFCIPNLHHCHRSHIVRIFILWMWFDYCFCSNEYISNYFLICLCGVVVLSVR